MKTLVVALGGNALLQRGEALTAENQYRNIASAVPATARLARTYRGYCPWQWAAGWPAFVTESRTEGGRALSIRCAGGRDAGHDWLYVGPEPDR